MGDAGVGKTSIFWRYIKDEAPLDHLITTIDFRYKNIQVQEREVKLCIWDTAGQEKFRSIVATYFKSCDGVVLVLDLGSAKSWESVKTVWYEMAVKRAPNACFMLLGAKKDQEVKVDLEDVNTWCKQKGIYFIQTSAMAGENVHAAFFTLAALIDCSKGNQPSMVSSFATSNSSGRLKRTDTTKECEDFGLKVPKEDINRSDPMESHSFYLKKDKTQQKRSKNCCRL